MTRRDWIPATLTPSYRQRLCDDGEVVLHSEVMHTLPLNSVLLTSGLPTRIPLAIWSNYVIKTADSPFQPSPPRMSNQKLYYSAAADSHLSHESDDHHVHSLDVGIESNSGEQTKGAVAAEASSQASNGTLLGGEHGDSRTAPQATTIASTSSNTRPADMGRRGGRVPAAIIVGGAASSTSTRSAPMRSPRFALGPINTFPLGSSDCRSAYPGSSESDEIEVMSPTRTRTMSMYANHTVDGNFSGAGMTLAD
ncbi:hypothetical protein BASA81_011392 [Batrachochytrium salamandrivorans]|nr:hypothetical protein BASA81_011392 [Batrachochytrium salamandrivorans]